MEESGVRVSNERGFVPGKVLDDAAHKHTLQFRRWIDSRAERVQNANCQTEPCKQMLKAVGEGTPALPCL